MKRRANVYYRRGMTTFSRRETIGADRPLCSDLFGRSAAYEDAEAWHAMQSGFVIRDVPGSEKVLLSARSRPKSRTGHEDHLIVHQDTSVQVSLTKRGRDIHKLPETHSRPRSPYGRRGFRAGMGQRGLERLPHGAAAGSPKVRRRGDAECAKVRGAPPGRGSKETFPLPGDPCS